MKPVLTLLAALITTPALAHTGVDHIHSFTSGFSHPFMGYDHLLAMVLVGVWASLIGGARQWIWPVSFVGAMVAGGTLGLSGVAVPAVEMLIAGSVVALGLGVALSIQLPIAFGAALIAALGVAHGYAHGAEAGNASFASYAIGFVLATSCLHATGLLGARMAGSLPTRIAGGAAVLVGLAMVLT